MSERLHADRARAESFGAVAEEYERFRPEHSAELLDELVAAGPGDALDVACGTGKVAAALVERGVRVLGVEIDERMAAVARARGIEVEVAPFETWDDAGRRFDLLTCGSAWHWIDPAGGAAAAARVLRHGGVLACFWTLHRVDGDAFEALDTAYRSVGTSAHVNGAPPRADSAPAWPDELIDLGSCFGPVEPWTIEAACQLSVADWIGMTSTFSDHQRLTSVELTRLQAAVRTALDEFGDVVPTTRFTHAFRATRR
jgi:SAM-dependent methyltransferase